MDFSKVERTLRAGILVGLGAFFLLKLVDGSLLFYINARFEWLIWVGAALFLALGVGYWWLNRQEMAHAAHHDHEHHEHSEHIHEGNGSIAWFLLVVAALPLLLGVLIPPRPLGASAVSTRGLSNFGSPQAASERLRSVSGERDILDWLRQAEESGSPEALDGQQASVIGFVFRDDRLAANQFMLTRFTVSCCVADAAPVALLVHWPDTAGLAVDSWVRVDGTFAATTIEGDRLPALQASAITPIEQPAQPYLYP